MSNSTLSPGDRAWLKKFGQNLARLIEAKGYASPYDFWVRKAGDSLSRASINNVVAGSKNFQVTTARKIAKLLGVRTADLFKFD